MHYLDSLDLFSVFHSEGAAIIIDIYMYVPMSMAIITVEILSNMETKLVLVLHLDHKPLNIKTTQ